MIGESLQRSRANPRGEPDVTRTILLTALVLAATATTQAQAAPIIEDDASVLRIYGPPRNRVKALSSRVATVRRSLPIIIVRRSADLVPEATASDLQRWLNRDVVPSLRTVGQTPTAAPGGSSYELPVR